MAATVVSVSALPTLVEETGKKVYKAAILPSLSSFSSGLATGTDFDAVESESMIVFGIETESGKKKRSGRSSLSVVFGGFSTVCYPGSENGSDSDSGFGSGFESGNMIESESANRISSETVISNGNDGYCFRVVSSSCPEKRPCSGFCCGSCSCYASTDRRHGALL